MTDTVDVLIIGPVGAVAAFASSIAETKMRIVCLEQGDSLIWLKLSESTGRDRGAAGGDSSQRTHRR